MKQAINNPNFTPLNNIGFSISPNPASDILNIGTENGDIKGVSIFDISGRQVLSESYTEGLYQLNLNVADFVNGTYIVQIQKTTGDVERTKLVIQK